MGTGRVSCVDCVGGGARIERASDQAERHSGRDSAFENPS